MTNLITRLKIGSNFLKLPNSNREQTRLLYIQSGVEGKDIIIENNAPYESIKTKLSIRLHGKLDFSKKMLDLLPNGATIVDIGAGQSLFDIVIAIEYRHKDFKFVLVDGDQFDENTMVWAKNLYNENGHQTYNNWEFVKELIAANNLPLANFSFVKPENFKKCDADLVMSHSSWCWHYPLEEYFDIVKAGLKPHGFLFLSPGLNVRSVEEKINHVFGQPYKIQRLAFESNLDHHSQAETQRITRQYDEGIINTSYFKFFSIWQRQ